MSKILTDDLILDKLAMYEVYPSEDLDYDKKINAIKDHFDFSITANWGNPDIMFYTETTSDGYEVWVATEDDRKPSINEDIYYYENDWLEKMADAMTDGRDIYFQDYDDDAENYEFQEVIDEVYDDYFNDKKQEVENELIDEGYEWEDE
jgi:hypothetical protein